MIDVHWSDYEWLRDQVAARTDIAAECSSRKLWPHGIPQEWIQTIKRAADLVAVAPRSVPTDCSPPTEVYDLLRHFVKNGDVQKAKGMAERYLIDQPNAELHTAQAARHETDWPIILDGIDPALLMKSRYRADYVGILLAVRPIIPIDEPNQWIGGDRTEQARLAVKLKQRIYRDVAREKKGRHLSEYDITPQSLSSFLGRYLLPWTEFCEFMYEHFDEFHRNPGDFCISFSEANAAPFLWDDESDS